MGETCGMGSKETAQPRSHNTHHGIVFSEKAGLYNAVNLKSQTRDSKYQWHKTNGAIMRVHE